MSINIPEGGEFANLCNQYVFESPLPPLVKGPYLPLYEFITQNWDKTTKTETTSSSNDTTVITESSSVNYDSRVPKDKVSIIDIGTGLQRTFHEQEMTATKLASYLYNQCQLQGRTGSVAMFCPNHVDYLPVCLAVALCGAKITPVNPLYTLDELTTLLQKSRTVVFVVHVSKLQTAMQAMKDSPTVKHVIVISDDDDDDSDDHSNPIEGTTVSLNYIRNNTTNTITQSTMELLNGDTSDYPFCVPYSSGTSGLPKGVCLSHANTVSNMLQCYEIEKESFLPHHTLISPLPFFHIYAFTVSMLYSAWQGHTLITTSGRFDLEQFCHAVQQYKPERAHLVPPIMIGLGKHPVVDLYDMSSLKTISSAAAPLSSDAEKLVHERLGGTCLIKQGWGMSELSPIGACSTDSTARSGSVGTLIPSTYGKVIDPVTGRSLPPNTPGELCIKGPQVMMGYLDEPDKTADCLSSTGWLRTGDIALYDNDGYIYITDRIKELIKVNGFQVAPAELEALLITHPNVTEAAVISVPHHTMGEAPRAYIILKSTTESTTSDSISTITTTTTTTTTNTKNIEDEIYNWLSDRVAPYKRLKGGIVITASIPKSVSGKILRRLLKDEYMLQQSSNL